MATAAGAAAAVVAIGAVRGGVSSGEAHFNELGIACMGPVLTWHM